MPQMNPKPGIKFGIPDPPQPREGDPPLDTSYHAYPKVLYKNEPDEETGAPYQTVQVANATEHAALGDGWVETPAGFEVPVTKKVKAKV